MGQEAESNEQKTPSRRRCLALGGLLVTCLNGSAVRRYARMEQAASVEPELRLRVRVCNYAAVPVKTLAQAELLTAAIFQTAGVKTVWVDGFPTGGLSIRAESAVSPAPDIDLRILTTSMGGQLGFPQVSPSSAVRAKAPATLACSINALRNWPAKLLPLCPGFSHASSLTRSVICCWVQTRILNVASCVRIGIRPTSTRAISEACCSRPARRN